MTRCGCKRPATGEHGFGEITIMIISHFASQNHDIVLDRDRKCSAGRKGRELASEIPAPAERGCTTGDWKPESDSE